MQHLDLIAQLLTVVNSEVVKWHHGFEVVFLMILLFKYKFFSWWDSQVLFRLKYNDICYFCFCFWVSVIISLLGGGGFTDIVVSTIISRFLFIKIIGI